MAGIISYETGDIVEMKKKHPCGSNEWEILKAGADIKMKCMGCGHEVIIKRSLVQKNTKKLKKAPDIVSFGENVYFCTESDYPMEKISLISRVRAGDRKAFDELCRKYYAMLVSYARLFLKDDWAEDVVQDVFYNVWQRRETLDDSNSLYKYLLRSVYNRSLNYLDKNRRAGEYGAYYRERIAALGSSYYAPDNSPVVQKLYNDDLRASLDAAIESLPPKCREVFRLSYIEDLSNREIGEQLGISPRTVENHMYAALKQLRRKLSKEQLLLLLSLLFMRGV